MATAHVAEPASEKDLEMELDDSGFVHDGTLPQNEEADKSHINLLDLCDDVLLCILKFCEPRDLKALGFTCHRLGNLIKDRTLWVHFRELSQPTGKVRLTWYLAHVLNETTETLVLNGYAKYVNDCCGFYTRTIDKDPEPLNLTGLLKRPYQGIPDPDSPGSEKCHGPTYTVTPSVLRRMKDTCLRITTLALDCVNIDCFTTNLSYFPSTVVRLSLRGSRIYNQPNDKSFLFRINDYLPSLEELNISSCQWVEGAALLPLSKLPLLTKLIVKDCAMLKECVAYASLTCRYGFRKLKILDLRGTLLGDSELSAVGRLPSLEELYISPMELQGTVQEHWHYTSKCTSTTKELDLWELDEPDIFAKEPIVHYDSDSDLINPETNTPIKSVNTSTRVLTVTFNRDARPSVVENVILEEAPAELERRLSLQFKRKKLEAERNANLRDDCCPQCNKRPFIDNDIFISGFGGRSVNISGEGRSSVSGGTSGVNKAGEGSSGVNKSGEGTSGVNKSGEGTSGVNKAGEGSSGVNKAGEGTSGVNKAGEGSCGVNKILEGLSNSGEGTSGLNKSGEGSNKSGEGTSGVNKSGEGSSGVNNSGEGSSGLNKSKEGSSGVSKSGKGTSGANSRKRKLEDDSSSDEEENKCPRYEVKLPDGDAKVQKFVKFRMNKPPIIVTNEDVESEAGPSGEGNNGQSSGNKVESSSNNGESSPNNGESNGNNAESSGNNGEPNNDAERARRNLIEDNSTNPDRCHVFYVNVGRQQHEIFQVSIDNDRPYYWPLRRAAQLNNYVRPELINGLMQRFMPNNVPYVDTRSVVTDSTIRNFGIADSARVNYFNIGPNWIVSPSNRGQASRPNKSNLRVFVCTGYTNITNASLEHLSTAAPNLTIIDVRGTKVNEEGVNAFKAIRPDCEVLFGEEEISPDFFTII